MAEIPRLETQRLILTGPTLTDFADMAAMWADPEVVRHIGGVPFSEEDSWARLLKYVGHWQLMGFGTWMVRDKSGGFVGEVGLFDLHRVMEPKLDVPEVGWVLAKRAHGKGYATEAVQRALAWGEQQLGKQRFSCIIDVGNEASMKVAGKCGFKQITTATYKDHPVNVYRR
jgi:RimJ/RimL family protein N-acetyltransferase